MIFYDGVRALFIIFTLGLLIVLLFFRRYPLIDNNKNALLVVLLSCVLVPLFIGYLKSVTNIPCPTDLEHYGGSYPYVTMLSDYPSTFQQSGSIKCYPAGHASGGFALMSLFFLFSNGRKKKIALVSAILFGWTIGNYKMEDFPQGNLEVSPPVKKEIANKRILVAEDDGPSFSLLELLLKKWGFEVVWAKNGKRVLNMLANKQKFDLILMDMNMSIMNGFDATIQIKELYPENIVIAQTAYAVSGDRERALAIGCDDYITKPF